MDINNKKVKVCWQDGNDAKGVWGHIVDDDVESITLLTEDGARFKIFKKFLITIMEEP